MNTVQLTVAFVIAAVAGARGTWSPCGLSMVSAINPMAERARGNRYWLTVAWFVAGSVLGGALLGGAAVTGAWTLGTLGVAATGLLTAAVAACLVTLAADLRVGGFRLPLHPRQVNERWLMRYRRWLYASGFGVQIGAGLATYVMTSAVYLTVALAVLTASPGAALAVGVCFGLVRGLAVLLTARVHDTDGLRRLHRRLDALTPWSMRAAAGAQAGAAVTLAAVLSPTAAAGTAVCVAAMVVLTRAARGLRARLGASLRTPLAAPLGAPRRAPLGAAAAVAPVQSSRV